MTLAPFGHGTKSCLNHSWFNALLASQKAECCSCLQVMLTSKFLLPGLPIFWKQGTQKVAAKIGDQDYILSIDALCSPPFFLIWSSPHPQPTHSFFHFRTLKIINGGGDNRTVIEKIRAALAYRLNLKIGRMERGCFSDWAGNLIKISLILAMMSLWVWIELILLHAVLNRETSIFS